MRLMIDQIGQRSGRSPAARIGIDDRGVCIHRAPTMLASLFDSVVKFTCGKAPIAFITASPEAFLIVPKTVNPPFCPSRLKVFIGLR